jgi:hypothetical protein
MARHSGQRRPKILDLVDVEALVKIYNDAEPRFIDAEHRAEPEAEEFDHRRIGVRECDRPVTLGPFARIKRYACHEERLGAEFSDQVTSNDVQLLDVAELRFVPGVATPASTGASDGWHEGDVTHPDRRRGFRDVQRLCDLDQGLALGAEPTSLVLFPYFAAVSHSGNVRTYVRSVKVVRRVMRFRVGLAFGFAAGYYLGAKAGRERYEQLRRLVARTPLAKVQAAADLGRARLHAGHEPLDAVVPPSPN